MVLPNPVIGLYAASGLVEPLPILVSEIFWRLAPAGVPPPVLPFVQPHKPHDIINTLFSRTQLFAFAVRTFTSFLEHTRQFRCGITAFFFQQALGINPAATDFSTLDVPQVLEAKQQTAGEISVFAANG